MMVTMDDVKFRVHEKRMSDNSAVYIPEGGFLTPDGGRTWVRLCLGECKNMADATAHIEDFKAKNIVVPVENIYHEVQ